MPVTLCFTLKNIKNLIENFFRQIANSKNECVMLFHKLSAFCAANIENLLQQTPITDFQNINLRKQTYHKSIFIRISTESVLL